LRRTPNRIGTPSTTGTPSRQFVTGPRTGAAGLKRPGALRPRA
jgi:hypothetical protein